jgi:type IV pilus assembly protein PilC
VLLFGRLPLSSLIELCRVLRHSLGAGIMLRDVFRRQVRKGSAALRPIAGRIADSLEEGDSLQTALEREKRAFPPLFLALASVGENTGQMPEIFGELERYYILQQRFWRQLRSQCLWPAIELFGSIFVIAFVIWVMGFIAQLQNTRAHDPLGAGLTGTAGALKFLALCFGTMGAVVAAYLLVSRSLRHRAVVDNFLLHLPSVGRFLMAFNLSRFALALRFTLDSGMPVGKAVELSLRATGNGAFIQRDRVMQEVLRAGESLSLALAKANLFPEEFLHIVAVAEEGGRVPEVMGQQSEQYAEEVERWLAVMPKILGFAVWVLVACLIIFVILRFWTWYFNSIDQLIR